MTRSSRGLTRVSPRRGMATGSWPCWGLAGPTQIITMSAAGLPRSLHAQGPSFAVHAPVLRQVPVQVRAQVAEHNRRRLLPAAGAHDHLADPDHSVAHGVESLAARDVGLLDEQQRRPAAVVADRGHGQPDRGHAAVTTGLLDLALPTHDLATAELAERIIDHATIGFRCDVEDAHLHELVAAPAEDRL